MRNIYFSLVVLYSISHLFTIDLLAQNSINNISNNVLNNNKMNTQNDSLEKDKEILLSMVNEMAQSFTGKQSTRNWADNALWFDVPPIAVRGKEKSCGIFENAFRQLKSIKVEILSTDIFINGNIGIVCTIQKWNSELKDGTINEASLIRQTNCFERQNGVWKLIHQHDSIPAGEGWDGKIIE